MITVTLGEVKTKDEKPFPKLMKDSGADRIVYFIAYGSGFQLNHISGDYEDKSPHFSKEWAMQFFTDYNEPITLQNA